MVKGRLYQWLTSHVAGPTVVGTEMVHGWKRERERRKKEEMGKKERELGREKIERWTAGDKMERDKGSHENR